MSFVIRLEKENFKFSCSHFTIMGPGQAERLHGHNYYVSLEIQLVDLDSSLGMAFDFNLVKPLVREITDSYDELVLLPDRSPYLKIEQTQSEYGECVRATFDGKDKQKRYEFPSEDVKLLPVVNVTSEELAREIGKRLAEKMRSLEGIAKRVRQISVGVQETRGQSVSYQLSL